MKKLLIITQKVDEQDDLLGFFVAWIREFALHFDHVEVIALAVGKHTLPSNVAVHSLSKERGVAKPIQYLRAVWLMTRLTPGSTAIFAHMSPIFAILAWPFARLSGSKLALWYLHRSVTLKLRLAVALCDVILTADAESLRIASKKVIAVGHGIEADRFATVRDWSEKRESLRIISVGRISPIKNYETLIEACRILKERGVHCTITIVGRPVMPSDSRYLESLRSKVKNYALESTIRFAGYIPYTRIPDYYKNADIVVNLTPAGGIDKTVLEGMASGALILASNEVLRRILRPFEGESLCTYGDPADLATHIQRMSALPVEKKSEMSKTFVETVKSGYDVTHVIERIQKCL